MMGERSGAPPRRVHQIPPQWFRRLVRPAYHRSWNEAERDLLDDSNQRRRVDELVTELSSRGFERPVVVERENWWSPRLRVSDGVHRVVAATRLGVSVPVRLGHDHSGECDHGDVYRVTVGGTTAAAVGADPVDVVMVLASFRSAAGPWIQSDSAAGTVGGPVDICLPRHPELRQQIAAELQERLRSAGVDAVVEFLEVREAAAEE